LTELSSRHSVLTKQKVVKDKPRIQSNSGKLTSWLTTGTSDQPMIIADDTGEPIIRVEDDDEPIILGDIPEAGRDKIQARRSSRNKRRRVGESEAAASDTSDSDDSVQFASAPSSKRAKMNEIDINIIEESETEVEGGKKKLGINTSYDGFSIYGRILCLIVKRKGSKHQGSGSEVMPSQRMMENWVSTQAFVEGEDDD